ERLHGVGERFALRMGLRFIKGLSREDGRRVEAAEGGGAFDSLVAFIRVTAMPIRGLRLLAEAGALDCFGLERRQTLWTIDGAARFVDPLALDAGVVGAGGVAGHVAGHADDDMDDDVDDGLWDAPVAAGEGAELQDTGGRWPH